MRIQVDNGSEFISKALDKWAYDNAVTLDFSRPGKPTDNPYIESFNGSFRDECLNLHWFLSLEDARTKIEAWRNEYNSFRPHQSLDDLTPDMFVENYHRKKPDSLSLAGRSNGRGSGGAQSLKRKSFPLLSSGRLMGKLTGRRNIGC